MSVKNLDNFFEPESVAIIGASNTAGKVGHTILRNFKGSDFDGDVYPVNPSHDDILGFRCYDSLKEVPENVDQAIVTVPVKIANEIVKECVEQGVPAVTMITSGYEEVGDEGLKRQKELEKIIEGTDTRLLGPNCIGVWDAFSGTDTLFFTNLKLQRPPKGSIALVSQSGAVGGSVLDKAGEIGIGFSRFVSYGNQLDVSEADLIEWLSYDDETEAIAAYIEGVDDGERFYKVLEDVSYRKPVIILKSGKSEKGSKAASSHTGSLAGSYQVYKGMFQQLGVIEAESIDQLFDKSTIMAYENPPDGKNVAVITNGGGHGVLSADMIESNGLELAEFSDETEEKLDEIMPDYGNVNNPLDVIGDADIDRYRKALEVIAKDPNVDSILAIVLLQLGTMDSDIIEVFTHFNDTHDKPMVSCMMGGEYTYLHMKNLEHNKVPTFTTPERAVSALKGLCEYGEWLRNKSHDGKDKCTLF